MRPTSRDSIARNNKYTSTGNNINNYYRTYNNNNGRMSSGPQNNNNNNPTTSAPNPIVTYYNEWSERTPFVTKYSVIILVIAYIISWFFDASDWFADIPFYTLLRFEVYRLLLNPFVGNSLLMLLLTIVMFVIMAGKFESSQGSLRFLFLMGTMSLLTNLAFIIFCFIGLIWDDVALFWQCQGFWNVCFALITIDCVLVSVFYLFNIL